MNLAYTCQQGRLDRPDFIIESLLTYTTKYDDTRNPKELGSTTVFGLAPLKDHGLYLASTGGRIVLKEANETCVYRRVSSQR